MADVVERGVVTTIALKKCGSSSIHRAFQQKTWEPQQFPDTWAMPRWFTAIRNPGLRLVSCWNHLVKNRYDRPNIPDPNVVHSFGPPVPFPQWVEWVLAQDPETINPHMRHQTYELADALRDKPDGEIFIAQLEQVTRISCGHKAKPVTDFLQRRLCIGEERKRHYPAWHTFYDRVLLQRVRWHFASDWHLWLHLYSTGYKRMQTPKLVKFLNLTNGRHSVPM